MTCVMSDFQSTRNHGTVLYDVDSDSEQWCQSISRFGTARPFDRYLTRLYWSVLDSGRIYYELSLIETTQQTTSYALLCIDSLSPQTGYLHNERMDASYNTVLFLTIYKRSYARAIYPHPQRMYIAGVPSTHYT